MPEMFFCGWNLRFGHDARAVVRPFRDRRFVDIQVLGDHRRRRMRQPVGQRDLFVARRPEDRDKNCRSVSPVFST